jgi:ketosteroid isomerase-like protein
MNITSPNALVSFATMALLTFAMPAVSQTAAAQSAVETEIARLEEGFNKSYGANDLDEYFAYYANDLVAMFPEGRTDLKSYRKMWTEYVHAGNRLEPVHYTDLVVRASPAGDAAIASYRIAVRTHLANGKVTDELFDETDVWLKRGGHWKVAHVHYSAVPAKSSP